jgi:hypothetical protein
MGLPNSDMACGSDSTWHHIARLPMANGLLSVVYMTYGGMVHAKNLEIPAIFFCLQPEENNKKEPTLGRPNK